jgi:hypothetical protein
MAGSHLEAAERGVPELGAATAPLTAIGTLTVIAIGIVIGTAIGIVIEMTTAMNIMTVDSIAGGTSITTTTTAMTIMTEITIMIAKSNWVCFASTGWSLPAEWGFPPRVTDVAFVMPLWRKRGT